jgi:hypothetical protein
VDRGEAERNFRLAAQAVDEKHPGWILLHQSRDQIETRGGAGFPGLSANPPAPGPLSSGDRLGIVNGEPSFFCCHTGEPDSAFT